MLQHLRGQVDLCVMANVPPSSTASSLTALRPCAQEKGLTVAQLLEHRVDRLWQSAPLIADLGALFADSGHDLYLVGGSVRDALMGMLGHDLDFTTDAHPCLLYTSPSPRDRG